jgi:hypothetical protein
MIGSIIGVGVMNSLLRGRDGTSGVDWDQAYSIGKTLLVFADRRLRLLFHPALDHEGPDPEPLALQGA